MSTSWRNILGIVKLAHNKPSPSRQVEECEGSRRKGCLDVTRGDNEPHYERQETLLKRVTEGSRADGEGGVAAY